MFYFKQNRYATRVVSRQLVAIVCSLAVTVTAANGQVIFEDEFGGNSLDPNHWSYHVVWLNPTQTRDSAHVDALDFTGDTVKLPLQTYNPTAVTPGDSFYGTDIVSKHRFDREDGLIIKSRLRLVDDSANPLSRGIVGGFFPFETDPPLPGVWDEIDFELLSNDVDDLKMGDESKRRVLTNVFDEYHFSDPNLNPHKPEFVALPGIDLTEFNVFEIRWLPEQIEWYVNGSLRRTEDQLVPDDAMHLHFNIHAPGPGFEDAHDPNFQPTADPNDYRTFFLEIDYVTVSRIPELDGDFDNDGVVDGSDFLMWQRGFGTIYDATDLADWEANYGMVAPLLATSAAVPEPTTPALALAALCLVMGRRRSH